MQTLSNKMGENQYAKITCECLDCNKEFTLNLERTFSTEISISGGFIGKRKGTEDLLFKCPVCGEKEGNSWGSTCEVYSRVVGYLRPVSHWNAAKQQEFTLRKAYDLSTGETK